jgi:hypothetical protein
LLYVLQHLYHVMSIWDDYPATYRRREVEAILTALHAGECAAVVGLSGAGKSNLMGFLAHRAGTLPVHPQHRLLLVDCNRLSERTTAALSDAIRLGLDPGDSAPDKDGARALEVSLSRHVSAAAPLSLLLDRFDDLRAHAEAALPNNLRALRDAHKYDLTFVTATRRPLADRSELAELFYANTLWLGPLSDDDARWNVARFQRRRGLQWDEHIAAALIEISRGYPAMLRACCEAHAAGAPLDAVDLAAHPAVRARVEEFWVDAPTEDEIRASGLVDHPLLMRGRTPSFDTTHLTAKEHLLLHYLRSRPGEVCEKDDIIRAVWPEDKVIARGIRDDSLAQLVRRLREKIEADPAAPRFVLTVPGRGYRFVSV